MSLDTWKQAFYPVPADESDKSDAIQHSLTKWEGLRPDALAEHELEFFGGGIRDGLGNYLSVSASTCALCECHFDDIKCKDDPDIEPEDHTCGTCPLYLARGNVACDESRTDETISPFYYWTHTTNPEPMIGWLKKAQAWEDANDPKPTVTVRVHAGPKPEDARITADEAIALGEAIHQHVLRTSHVAPAKPAPKPPIGGLHHEGPANPSPREGD